MQKELLKRSFEKMGAHVDFDAPNWRSGNLNIDVVTPKKKKKSHFVIQADDDMLSNLTVLDIDPKGRHLLLLQKENILARDGKNVVDTSKFRYLLGHDERDWFVAGVPDDHPVSTIRDAKAALKPMAVLDSLKKKGVKTKNHNKRKNKGFLRQGEWFFVPTNINLDDEYIHTKEPISRGRAKPHVVSEIVRLGGRQVYTHRQYPEGVTKDEQAEIMKDSAFRFGWTSRLIDASVYGRGTVRHADHATLKLPGWHIILSNTEDRASRMGNMTFLD